MIGLACVYRKLVSYVAHAEALIMGDAGTKSSALYLDYGFGLGFWVDTDRDHTSALL